MMTAYEYRITVHTARETARHFHYNRHIAERVAQSLKQRPGWQRIVLERRDMSNQQSTFETLLTWEKK
jgi:hypothetical protein